MTYGIPYRGSKSRIAKWLIDQLPPGEILVDIFAGGCAVTHAALLSGKWNKIITNDIGDGIKLFEDSVHGRYEREMRWISRKKFFDLKDSDPYISLCWSFGNNRSDYLYSREIEPWKRALHYARVMDDTSLLLDMGIRSDGSKADIKANEAGYRAKYSSWMKKEILNDSFSYTEHLERLQRLNRLKSLESLQGIEYSRQDYRNVKVPENAIVYADPPYRGTGCKGYETAFDHKAFDRWLSDVPFMVITSEYTAPEGCIEVAKVKKQSSMGTGNKGGCTTEKLFVQERFASKYRELMHHDRP